MVVNTEDFPGKFRAKINNQLAWCGGGGPGASVAIFPNRSASNSNYWKARVEHLVIPESRSA